MRTNYIYVITESGRTASKSGMDAVIRALKELGLATDDDAFVFEGGPHLAQPNTLLAAIGMTTSPWYVVVKRDDGMTIFGEPDEAVVTRALGTGGGTSHQMLSRLVDGHTPKRFNP